MHTRRRWRRWGIGALVIILLPCLAGAGYIALGKWAWHAADGATIIAQHRSADGYSAHHPLESRTVSVTNAAQAHTLQYWLNETTVPLGHGKFSMNSTNDYYVYTIRLTWHGVVIEVASYDTRDSGWRISVLGWFGAGGRITAPGASPALSEILNAYPQLYAP